MAKTNQIRDEFSALTQSNRASNDARRTRSRHLQRTLTVFLFSGFVAFGCAVALLLKAVRVDATQAANISPQEEARLSRTDRIHISPPGASDSRYFYVPFKVPAGAARVRVAYDYDRLNGANTIDLGLFDARFSGRDDDSRGFRGWSGGRRSEVFVGSDDAANGYLPGAMPAGTWRVILGLYRVAPAGVDVSLTITIETNDSSTSFSQTPRATNLPSSGTKLLVSTSDQQTRRTRTPSSAIARSPARWFSGDLHMHTTHSDGDWTVDELISSARAQKLDFISITDHNTSSHHREIDARNASGNDLLVMRGEEITTYNGHANAWGLPTAVWLDFRVRAGDERRMKQIVGEAQRHGALISINHPTALCKGCDWTYSTDGYDAIEVWNGLWDAEDERALQMWDAMLRRGRRLTAIGSSDTHRPNVTNALARPTTHAFANSLTERALLAAIRDGRVCVTNEPKKLNIMFAVQSVSSSATPWRAIGEQLVLRRGGRAVSIRLSVDALPNGATVVLISNDGTLRRYAPDANGRVNVTERIVRTEIGNLTEFFLRVEARAGDAGAMLIFTNPIYVKVDAD